MLGYSRTQAAEIVEAGGVTCNGRPLGKSDRLIADQELEVVIPEPPAPVGPSEVPGMGILYDDEDIVIVDKPAGAAAHPSLGWDGPDVLSGLAAAGYRISTSGQPERKGIVSRLDVGTSGAMVVAKSEPAYSALKHAFKHREVKKVYHALCQGHPDQLVGTIEAPIGRHPSAEWKFAVTERGRHSVTHYEVIELLRSAALCEIHLETGRTHQIRVHFTALKHPLVGDTIYGADPVVAAKVGLDHQWLHAYRLGFAHPITGEWVEVESPYPADLQNALEIVRDWS
jgi:23S rRNA pseudouridine1911/1915/1917 synthase